MNAYAVQALAAFGEFGQSIRGDGDVAKWMA
jgi:hypothetical protein